MNSHNDDDMNTTGRSRDRFARDDSPWDEPWGPGPRRGGRGEHRGGPGGRGGRRGGPRGSWAGGPPPWVQGLISLAQSAGQPDDTRGSRFGGPGFGHGAGFGPGFAHRGPKVRRGDVRTAILDVLAAEPMNGYQIIQQIAERSGGAWKPSPGSVYPTVQQLEDEGLVEAHQGEGRRLLQLSAEGRSYVETHAEELAATWRPFDEADAEDDHGTSDLKPVIGQVMGAVWQIVVSGTSQQRAEAAEILADTRRRLYGLLADGGEETADSSDAQPSAADEAARGEDS